MTKKKLKEFRRIPPDCTPYRSSEGLTFVLDPNFGHRFMKEHDEGWSFYGPLDLSGKSLEAVTEGAPKMAVGFMLGHLHECYRECLTERPKFRKQYSMPLIYVRKKEGENKIGRNRISFHIRRLALV